MKIAFLMARVDVMGDAERAVLQHASGLADRHDVRVISVFKARRRRFVPPDERVAVHFLVEAANAPHRATRREGPDPRTAAALAALPSEVVERRWDGRYHRLADIELEYLLQDIDVDVLVPTSPALLAYAVRFAPARVMTVHHEQRPVESGGVEREPLALHGARCDALTFAGARSEHWFGETFGPGAARLVHLPTTLAAGYRPRSTLETRMVTLVSRLEKASGVGDALTAWAAVSAYHPDWSLRILGDGPHAGALHRQRDHLGLQGSVHFIGEASYLAEEWAKASIALHTAPEDAVGLSLMEAQAAGVPVIAYDAPGVARDTVLEGQTGLLVTPKDTDALASVLLALMEKQEMRWSMGQQAAANASRFQTADRWEQLLASLRADRDSGRREVMRAARVASYALHCGIDGKGRPADAAPVSTRHSRKLISAEDHVLRQGGASLVRQGGQVCSVLDSATPFDVMQSNLSLVASALERAGIPYFVTRSTKLRHSVAVFAGQRQAALKALAQDCAGKPVYMAFLNESDAAMTTTLASLADEFLDASCAGVRIYRNVVTPSRTLRLGAAYGCTISFWDDDPEDPAYVVSPLRTMIGARIPREALVRVPTVLGGRRYPTLAAFNQALHHDIAFPIDAVYTWVDGSDVAWLERKNAVLAAKGMDTEDAAASAARFRNRDELRYSLRSLDMFAPWIRNIYIVTDRQSPAWLDLNHPRVRVVDHTEIFGNEGALPTYNSHAIESRLHHIDGLSEQFLYFNDDVFMAKPGKPDLFFLGNGQSKHFMSSNAIPMNPVSLEDEYSRSAAKNNRELISWAFGRTLVNSFIHAPHPLRRSVMYDLEETFPDHLRATAASQLRDRSDVSVASSLHHYFGYYTGRSVPGRISSGFVNVGMSEQVKKLNQLLAARSNDVFCLNDFHDGDVSEDEQDATLAAFLPSYFPIASQFEAGSTRNQLFHAGRLPGWPL
ncbi:stealth conserved region 3 domain-containing protein [Streptomyces beihaiensis]|uniref:Stealth conserved region 3 domain-containing protein n=1 Tax=Streptomyces beihaiensis TaxID=2984495 RepID=A0ABT3TZV2_9ACTN|nr:stealth conserved region 3 domain-containing protein [Streptomyces beihaiensis]MCX3062576.1 stealth conserved region 3 domain-containing protein [Streptomyces beihaiensis]